MSSALVEIDLQGKLKRIASGKVRDVFEIDEETLLFVASDRISAYDVVMKNGIPDKGVLLTAMSAYWFTHLTSCLPHLRTHFLSAALPPSISSLPSLARRSMQVRRLHIYPLESIVRGYITGSAWAEYRSSGTVHGIAMPPNLVEGQKLEKPIWTPSTKAAAGSHDENISPDRAREVVGREVASEIERISLEVYEIGHQRCLAVGIILADTKLEFGYDPKHEDEIILVDEVLTPDSSRFWPADTYEAHLGRTQPSFDKQPLRDWLSAKGLKGKEGIEVPADVVNDTVEKYREAFERVTGQKWGA